MGRVFAQEVLEACQSQGVESVFEMILLAAHRAKTIPKTSQSNYILPAEEYENVSLAVTALREIESNKLDIQDLRESCVESLCTVQNKIIDSEDSDQVDQI